MSFRAKLFGFMLLVVLATGLFYLRSLAKHIFFELPLLSEESAKARLNEVALQSGSGPNEAAVLYLPSLNDHKLIAESRPVQWAQSENDRVRQVLLALTEESPHGLGHPLPTATEVRAVFLTAEGTAYIDFSNDILKSIRPGIETESLAVYSIVNSITTNIPSVKRVRILIQGQEVETLDGHIDLTEDIVPDPTLIKAGY
jgi:spore germination protein GerM